MFNISKIRQKSLFGPVKAQKFSRCLVYVPTIENLHILIYNNIDFNDPKVMICNTVTWLTWLTATGRKVDKICIKSS